MSDGEASGDIGVTALSAVFDSLQPDARWLSRGGRGFRWIPFRLAQDVSVSPMIEDEGTTHALITVRTVVAERVRASPAVVHRVLSGLNRHALGSGYVFLEDDARIEACVTARVEPGTVRWRALRVAGYATLQVGVTHAEARYVAEACDAVVARPGAAGIALPESRDACVDAVETQWANAGRGASRFADGAEFSAIEQAISHGNAASLPQASAAGLALRFPFGAETSLGRIASDDPHRRVGHGLRARLYLPRALPALDAHAAANALNLAESTGASAADHYGAWCVDTDPAGSGAMLQYQWAVPNGLYGPGVSFDTAAALARRAAWVGRRLRQHM